MSSLFILYEFGCKTLVQESQRVESINLSTVKKRVTKKNWACTCCLYQSNKGHKKSC